jgi:hypothetical protein
VISHFLAVVSDSTKTDIDPISWSVINAASGYAQLAAVLAGFVFIALTISITTPNQVGDQTRHDKSTTLLATAFIVLLIESLFFVVISGELNNYRATYLAVVATSVLGLGALLLMAGTAWLFHEHELAPDALKNFKLLSVFLLLLAAFFVNLTIEDVLRWSPETFSYWVPFGVSVGGLAILVLGYIALPRLSSGPAWWIRRVCEGSMVFLFLTSVLTALLIGSSTLDEVPDLASRTEGFLMNSWEYPTLAFVMTPLYVFLYAAVILVLPWGRWFKRRETHQLSN